jgi:ribosomal protein S21
MIETRRLNPPEGPLNVVLNAGTCASPPKGGEFLLPQVNVQGGETLESALWRFKRNVQEEDISNEIKRLSFHLKETHERSLARTGNRKKTKDVE